MIFALGGALGLGVTEVWHIKGAGSGKGLIPSPENFGVFFKSGSCIFLVHSYA